MLQMMKTAGILNSNNRDFQLWSFILIADEQVNPVNDSKGYKV
jgi:hypothetical protein